MSHWDRLPAEGHGCMNPSCKSLQCGGVFSLFLPKSCCLSSSRMILGVQWSLKVLAQPVLSLLLVQSPVPGRSRPLKYLESYTCNSSLCPCSCLQHHPFIAVSVQRSRDMKLLGRGEKKKKKKACRKALWKSRAN